MPRKRTTNENTSNKNKKTKIESLTLISNDLAKKCIENIRVLSADVVEKANSGHPGAPLGCSPIAHLLWGEFMNFNPVVPTWINRDRFILSNGHACALLYRFILLLLLYFTYFLLLLFTFFLLFLFVYLFYSMLHLSGYSVTLDDLKQFRQLDSITPGHPENFATPGVEVCTGPLGQVDIYYYYYYYYYINF